MTGTARLDPQFGIVAPELGWSPPLRYLLRRARVLSLLEDLPTGRLLEIGCGAGALLCDFALHGHTVTGLETAEGARTTATRLAKSCGHTYTVEASPAPSWPASFDTLCSFDVLEHIEDDHAALSRWLEWLRQGGHVLVSVPAHRRRWGAGDQWAGHYRRYDRHDLEQLMASSGLQVLHVQCYGFPLANLTEAVGNLFYRRMMRRRGQVTRQQATATSGTERNTYARLAPLMTSLPARWMLRLADAIQVLFSRTDWGSGFLVLARKT